MTLSNRGIRQKTFPKCGQPFGCGPQGEQKSCWCEVLSPIVPTEDGTGCRCPTCLDIEIRRQYTHRCNEPETASTKPLIRGSALLAALGTTRRSSFGRLSHSASLAAQNSAIALNSSASASHPAARCACSNAPSAAVALASPARVAT